MPVQYLFFDFGRGLFPRKPVLIPLADFLAERGLPPKLRFHDRKRHSNLGAMRPRKRRRKPSTPTLAKQGMSDEAKLYQINIMWKDRIPLSQIYLIGELTERDFNNEVIRQIEADFFAGEPQPRVHIELRTIAPKLRQLRIKHAKCVRLYVNIHGKAYPIVRAEDSNARAANFPLFLPTQ